MNKFLACLAVMATLLLSTDLWAQPTFRFPTEEHSAGDNFCIDVKTRDFTDLLTLKFTITWDPAVIRYTGVTGFNFRDLDQSDFDESMATMGQLKLNWADLVATGVTIPKAIEEDYVIFQICFKAISTFGQNSPICIAETPTPEVTRTGTNNINIGLYQVKGLIGTDVLPVVILVENKEVEERDFVCVDFKVLNFTNMVNMQFTIEYDGDLLEFDGVTNYNVLPRFNPATDVVSVTANALTFGWYTTQPATLADSTAIFSICFRAKGPCRSLSEIKITGSETIIEAVTNDEPIPGQGINIGVFPVNGSVRIRACDNTTGLNLVGTCPIGLPGETVCVDVTANRFQQLVDVEFLINWNPNVLSLINANALGGFNPTIVTTGAPDGTIRVDFARPPASGLTLADGTKIMQLCFRVIGDGTISTSVAFTGSPAVVKKQGSNTNIGLDPDNGCVIVKAPPGLTLSAENFEGFNGEKVCVDVKVANFNGISKMQFTLNYEATIVRLDSISAIAVPGMTTANFNDLGAGFYEVNWANPFGFGESLPDGETAFRVCFTIIGDPNLCTTIDFIDEPVSIDINTEESGDFNIGLNANPGRICVLDPGKLKIIGSDVRGDLDQIVCVDVTVENFTGITGMQYSLRWDFSDIQFDHLNFPGGLPTLSNGNFDFTDISNGVLTLSWDQAGGATLPDGTIIFSVCFKIVGEANTCVNVRLAEDPLNIFVSTIFSNGANVGLNKLDGRVCINDYLRIIDVNVVDVACPGTNSGAVFLRLAGGLLPYRFNWGGTGQTGNNLIDVPSGTYPVTITDNSIPPRTLTGSYTVEVSGTAPFADGGSDVGMNCNSTPTKLDGKNSTQGLQVTYQWTLLSGSSGGFVPPSDRTLTPTVLGPGIYQLEVSEAGCSSFDTVIVTNPIPPIARAGGDKSINCQLEEVALDAGASTGRDLRYQWSVVSGSGEILPNTEASRVAIATAPGTYELTVRELSTGCTATDTVVVLDDKQLPIADAGPQQALPCVADTIGIGGMATSVGSRFTYEWVVLQNGNIISGRLNNAAEVNATGLYQLTVQDTVNGCSASDTVRVIGDPNRPVAHAGNDGFLDCRIPCLRLDGSQSSQGTQFAYEWTSLTGGTIPPGQENTINPEVCEAGLFLLKVRNIDTGCEDVSTVRVSQNREVPRARAGADVNLGCKSDPVYFDGQGSSVGTEFIYKWTTDGSGSIADPDSLATYLQGSGLYILEVTNTLNGCVALDTVELLTDTTTKPFIQISPLVQKLNCRDTMVSLNAIGSTNGPGYNIVWGPANCVISGGNTLTPRVKCEGTYTLTILNSADGCFSTRNVRVERDTVKPVAMVVQSNETLPCIPNYVVLDGTGSSTGPFITYSWVGKNGSNVQNPFGQITTTFSPDTYFLTVRNVQNWCQDTTSMTVLPNTNPIVAKAGEDGELTCTKNAISYDGIGSTVCTCIVYQWLDNQGDVISNDLNFTTSQAGVYVLFMRDTTDGCIASDTVSVRENKTPPTVNAGQDLRFDCDFTEASLSGQVTGGSNISINWTSLEGNPIIGASTLQPTINEAGTYILTATDQINGCSAEDRITVQVSSNLEQAEAAADFDRCEEEAMLLGNLPPNTSGIWTSLNSENIVDPQDPGTLVRELSFGEHTFIWTLSTADCPDYSADTVRIQTEGKPELRNDIVTLSPEFQTIDIQAVANDNLFNTPSWIFSIVEGPTHGNLLSMQNGTLTYGRLQGFKGADEIIYAVCNAECLDLCDTAFIKINVEIEPPRIDTLPPNAITPNGDGKNETLVFSIIEEAPNSFPESELIVFNRWGDVVFNASPYLNDWAGTNKNGRELPQGTYYYILRLNISDGKILRGDVTILK